MKTQDYECNICGAELIQVEELIGFGIKNQHEFYPKHIETADYHICGSCLDSLESFTKYQRKLEQGKMSPAEKYSWRLNW